MEQEVAKQLEITKYALMPESEMHRGMIEFVKLVEIFFKYLEAKMDKQINKIKKDLTKGQKDTKKLLKMDHKQDKKIEKCDKMSCSAKSHCKGMKKK